MQTAAYRFDDGDECVQCWLFDLILREGTFGMCHCSSVSTKKQLHEAGVVFHLHLAPEWNTNITVSHFTSLAAVSAGWLLFPTHSIHSTVSVRSNTESEFGWKPWQWLVTIAVTRHHSGHSSGLSSCRLLQNHSVFLHCSLKKMQPSVGFRAFYCPKAKTMHFALLRNGSLTPFLSHIYTIVSLNNSWKLNLEVFILDIYLTYDRRPGTCQPC